MAVCVASAVLLCFDVLGLDRASTRGVIVTNLDIVFTAVFGLEVGRAGGPGAGG